MNSKKLNRFLSFLITIALIASAVPSKVSAHHTWTNLSASKITDNTATIQGTVEFGTNGGTDVTLANYEFEYTTDPSFATGIQRIYDATTAVKNNSQVTVTKDIVGLNADTTYYFRLIFRPQAEDHASNWGQAGASFTTTNLAAPKTIKTGAVALSEKTLDQQEISLSINSGEYNPSITTAYIQLNNAPPGTTVGSVSLFSKTTLQLTLRHDGTDFDVDYPNFSITVKAGGFTAATSSSAATSNTIVVKSFIEIEGYDNYYSLGRSFPAKIEMSGYNVRDKEIHVHTTLHTNIAVGGQTAMFHYYIDVFNSSGVKIGSFGTYEAPKTIAASAAGAQDVTINDAVVSLTSPLTPSYRIVVLVKEVTLN